MTEFHPKLISLTVGGWQNYFTPMHCRFYTTLWKFYLWKYQNRLDRWILVVLCLVNYYGHLKSRRNQNRLTGNPSFNQNFIRDYYNLLPFSLADCHWCQIWVDLLFAVEIGLQGHFHEQLGLSPFAGLVSYKSGNCSCCREDQKIANYFLLILSR